MHLHTIAGTAVSAQKCGSASPFTVRLPITTTMVPDCGRKSSGDFVGNLGGRRLMFLRNHGTITNGRRIAQAFMLMHSGAHLRDFCRPIDSPPAEPTCE
jgi:ribulose-5-phosphate 4-epimerase/fuculose-1-phosphate aldolase